MKLVTKIIPFWPKLAWISVTQKSSDVIRVFHGPLIERGDGWLVEGCWAGQFEKGGFDRTDIIYGSGIRLRDNRAVFVPSGSTLDRIWWTEKGREVFISNSLPAILHVAGIKLLDHYNYTAAIDPIRHGIGHYQRSIPVVKGEINVHYFNNLVWDGNHMKEVDKPSSTSGFHSFEDYAGFLSSCAEAIGGNVASTERQFPVKTLTTVSKGYDSLVGAVLAKKHMGCEQAVTIEKSSSLWRGSDSGYNIAKSLNIKCTEYSGRIRNPSEEESFWAVAGKAMELNWSQFDYPEPLCLFITGVHGDKVWDRTGHDISEPFAAPSIAGMGLCEYRLIKGIFHCPLPYWGIRHLSDIRKISQSEEMKPWCIGGPYDRPIARRIIEEAGISRESFGQIKKNTQVAPYVLWPYADESKKSASQYAKKKGASAPSNLTVAIWRPLAQMERLIFKNLTERLGFKRRKWPWSRLAENNMLFQWGNDRLKTKLGKEFDDGIARSTDQAETYACQSNSGY